MAKMIAKSFSVIMLIFFVNSCSPVVTQPIAQANEPTPSLTVLSATSIPQPSVTLTPGPTDAFITQVMATKYAARTQYAAQPTVTPTATIAPSSPNCQAGDLQTTVATNGATGRIVLEIAVTNIGNSPCYLPSWPQVELMDRAGKPLEITYDYIYPDANPSNMPPTQQSNPGTPIVYGMDKNQTAGLELMWGNWCQGAVQGGVVIRVFLLNANSRIDISTDIEGGGYCDDTTSPSTIDVIGFGY